MNRRFRVAKVAGCRTSKKLFNKSLEGKNAYKAKSFSFSNIRQPRQPLTSNPLPHKGFKRLPRPFPCGNWWQPRQPIHDQFTPNTGEKRLPLGCRAISSGNQATSDTPNSILTNEGDYAMSSKTMTPVDQAKQTYHTHRGKYEALRIRLDDMNGQAFDMRVAADTARDEWIAAQEARTTALLEDVDPTPLLDAEQEAKRKYEQCRERHAMMTESIELIQKTVGELHEQQLAAREEYYHQLSKALADELSEELPLDLLCQLAYARREGTKWTRGPVDTSPGALVDSILAGTRWDDRPDAIKSIQI